MPSTSPASPGSPGASERVAPAPGNGELPPEAAAAGGSRSFAAELPVLVLIAFVLALVLKTFLVQAFYIPSGSMEPTLDIGDRVLVNKVVYQLRDPRRGEIIVFGRAPLAVQDEVGAVRRVARSLAIGLGLAPPLEQDFIKRVIGLPGETIEQRQGQIYIDGQPLPETIVGQGGYLSARDPQNDFIPLTVPDGEYFVMGDNRPNSSDSRFSLGTIAGEDIVGRAFVVIWPLHRLGSLRGADYPPQSQEPPLPGLGGTVPHPEVPVPALASW